MTDRQQEPESEEDPTVSRLYRSTRNEEPDGLLDAKILAEAKAATRHQRRRWWLPLSSAAVVLLGITLTLKLMEQAPRLPQSVDDFNYEQPAESQSTQQAEKKQAAPPAPAMMRESVNAPAKERIQRLKLHKAAPRSAASAPAGSSLQGLGSMDLSEAIEFDREDRSEGEIYAEPTAWLAHIQELVDRGEQSGARQALEAFLSSYPDYPLPESLQNLDKD